MMFGNSGGKRGDQLDSAKLWKRAEKFMQTGRLDKAKDVLEQLRARPHRYTSAAATLHLAYLEHSRDRLDDARALYLAAIEATDDELASSAVLGLHNLLDQAGEKEEAEKVLERAYPLRGNDAAAALLLLGVSLMDRGQTERARLPLRRVVASGEPDYFPTAALALANLLRDQGNQWGATKLYERAAEAGHGEASEQAAAALKVLSASY